LGLVVGSGEQLVSSDFFLDLVAETELELGDCQVVD
jgi:hypothetical protein